MSKVNWKVATARRVVGDWTPVLSLADIEAQVQPRKYSKAGEDEIHAYAISRQAGLKRESVKALVARGREAKEGEALSDDIIMDALGSADPELFKTGPLIRLQLKHGIAAVKAKDAEGTFEESAPTEEWIEAIMDDAEAVDEIVAIVGAFNVPLEPTTSGKSETS